MSSRSLLSGITLKLDNLLTVNNTIDNEFIAKSSGILTVADDSKSLYCPSPDKSTTKQFTADCVHGIETTPEDIYGSMVRPFIPYILAGEDCLILTYGHSERYNIVEGNSKTNYHGLVSLLTTGIFAEILKKRKPASKLNEYMLKDPPMIEDAFSDYKVTLSWCQIDPLHNEGISDRLRILTKEHEAQPLFVDPSIEVKDRFDGTRADICGLVEVEITNCFELQNIIRSVYLTTDRDKLQYVHNAITLNVIPKITTANNVGKDGSITFLTLGDIDMNSNESFYCKEVTPAPWFAKVQRTLGMIVGKTRDISELANSKLIKLLKDLFCRKIGGSVICTLHPGHEYGNFSYFCLDFLDEINQICGSESTAKRDSYVEEIYNSLKFLSFQKDQEIDLNDVTQPYKYTASYIDFQSDKDALQRVRIPWTNEILISTPIIETEVQDKNLLTPPTRKAPTSPKQQQGIITKSDEED